jgi:phospholipid/cholesterol/gamma-HCH transport system substrate-binding protein
MKGQDDLELIVGTVVVGALVVLFVFVFSISGTYALRPGYYQLKAQFSYVGGLRKGSPVELAGRPIGEVGRLDLVRDPQSGRDFVNVIMYIQKKVQIREKAYGRIYGTSFALSEPHVEIIQGGNEDGRFLEPGAMIHGVDPAVLDNLVGEAEKAIVHMRSVMEQMDAAISDPELQKVFRDTLYNMRNVTYSLNELLGGKESNVAQSVEDLAQAVKTLRTTMDKVDKGEGTIGKLVSSDELYNELMAFVKDLKAHPWKLMQKDDKSKLLGIF